MKPAVLALLFIINIRYGHSTPVIEPAIRELLVAAGDFVTFNCSGNDAVKWVDLASSQWKNVQQVGNTTVVRIQKAEFTDTGTYKCIYKDMPTAGSTSLHLFVKDSSNYWYAPRERLSANENTHAIIQCLITDPTITEVSLVSISVVKYPTKVSFNAHDGFTIYNVQKVNEGRYVCQATVNGQKKNSKEIRLSVNKMPKKPPSVTMKTDDEVRIEGERFHIICHAYGYVPPNIKWKHPAANVTTSDVLTISDSNWTFTSTLTIPEVKISNSGTYTCIGENNIGIKSVSVLLKVVDRGYVNLYPLQDTDIALKVGESLNLTVQIESYPSEVSWNWLHNHLENASASAFEEKMQSRGKYRMQNTLNLNRLKENESGNYTIIVTNSEASSSLNFKVTLYYPPRVKISSSFSNATTLRCNAQGSPLPTIKWFQCPGQICGKKVTHELMGKEKTTVLGEEVESVLYTDEPLENSTVVCNASNILGSDSAETIVISPMHSVGVMMVEHKLFNSMLISSLTVAAIFILISVFLYYKYKQKAKYEVRWQIVQLGEGNNYTCIDPTQLPYNEKWEFPRANLHFGKTLGAGAFGKVIEATAFGMGKDDSALKVAVKMLKSSAHTDEVEALMSELKILSHLGHHQNIVNLLGACTAGGPILVITEYCHHGDLLNFLRRKAEAMNNLFTATIDISTGDYKNMSMEQKYIRSDSGFSSQNLDNYIEMKPVSSNSMSDQGDSISEDDDTEDNLPLDLYDLLNFALQVAQGMYFLASKNCIHRDLAARNVLITHGRSAKICDFGLARDIENDSNYVVKGNARLPVKWMAPESIFDCIYTVQSDVWSYGILLWEIFSLGRSPYPGILVNRKFYKMIKDGYKMDCPDNAPLDVYCIMKACWNLEPTERPTFNEISSLIIRQMSFIKEQDYANITQAEQDQECDTKNDTQQPLIRGNNYQFC